LNIPKDSQINVTGIDFNISAMLVFSLSDIETSQDRGGYEPHLVKRKKQRENELFAIICEKTAYRRAPDVFTRTDPALITTSIRYVDSTIE
jgi:hypothetical protein